MRAVELCHRVDIFPTCVGVNRQVMAPPRSTSSSRSPPAKNHAFFALDNVVFTPHAAGVDLQSRDDMALSAATAIVALSKGEWPAEQIVNPAVRAQFRW